MSVVPASRNAPCPCGSGRRYKDCHGSFATPARPATLDDTLAQALAAQRAGRLDEAGRAYERALALAPENFDALHMLGVVHFQRQDFARARQLIARAIALQPEVAEARRNLRLTDNALRRLAAERDYQIWIATVEAGDRAARATLRVAAASAGAPRLSIVLPTYESAPATLRACLDSVLVQDYPSWQLCIADDASRSPHVRAILADYAARDPRIDVVHRECNGHISAASNSALALATGEFVALLDHDDVLAPHALGEVAVEIAEHPRATIVYSDEDKIDESGRRFEAYFKPDWNPALLTAQNYVSHLGAYRTELVRAVGGFREGVEGAQDWDLLLRCAERVDPATIRHIPRILYHWRAVQGSTARTMASKDYAAAAQERVVADTFARRGGTARIRRVLWNTFLESDPVADPAPTVSLILLGGDDESMRRWRDWMTAGVADAAAVAVAPAVLDGRPRALPRDAAAAINRAASRAAGDVLVIVDAGFTPVEPGRLAAWLAHAVQVDAGPVGALVLDTHRDIALGAFVLDPEAIAATAWHGEPEGYWGMAGRGALVQNVGAVPLGAMAVQRALWQSLGGFDVASFAERHRDVDLCLRAAAAGHRPIWHPGIVLVAAQPIEDRDALPGEREDVDAMAMRERWGELLRHDPAYHPALARAPRLFELALPGRGA